MGSSYTRAITIVITYLHAFFMSAGPCLQTPIILERSGLPKDVKDAEAQLLQEVNTHCVDTAARRSQLM